MMKLIFIIMTILNVVNLLDPEEANRRKVAPETHLAVQSSHALTTPLPSPRSSFSGQIPHIKHNRSSRRLSHIPLQQEEEEEDKHRGSAASLAGGHEVPSKDGTNKKKVSRGLLGKWTQHVLFFFLGVDIVWGLAATMGGMVVNYLISDDVGLQGFTLDRNVNVMDITHFEHQHFELPGIFENHDLTQDEIVMLLNRKRMTIHCSRFEVNSTEKGAHTLIDYGCYNVPLDFIQQNYFCAVVEHPEKFQGPYRKVIRIWLVTEFLFFGSIPLALFAWAYQNPSIKLLVAYVFFQVVPIFLIIATIVQIWNIFDFELCGIDYFYGRNTNVNVRGAYTGWMVFKMLFKLAEISLMSWFIKVLQEEKAHRGFGFRYLLDVLDVPNIMSGTAEDVHPTPQLIETAPSRAEVFPLKKVRKPRVSIMSAASSSMGSSAGSFLEVVMEEH